jgi:ADP-ribose pyrophosphatase
MKKWKTLSSKLALDNKWFKVQKDVVELPNGKVLDDFYIWNEPDVAQIVAVTKSKKIVLVRQYKHGTHEILIECPAGYVDENEDFESAAKRELLEETGYRAGRVELLGKFVHNPTKSSGRVAAYLAQGVQKSEAQKLDDNEEIEVMEVGFKEVVEMINKGEIWTSGTISSIFLALNKMKNN